MAKDFAKSKCFIKTDNGYEEITYEELLCREEADPSYKGRRFLPLHGMLMEVTPEQYRALMQGLEIVSRHPIQEVQPSDLL